MNNITLSNLFLILFVWIDDWYQQTISSRRLKNVGKKAAFSDSEMLTLLVAMDFIEFASERHYEVRPESWLKRAVSLLLGWLITCYRLPEAV